MALFGQIFEDGGRGGPGPSLGLGAAGQPERAEQHVAELLGAAGIDRLAGNLLDLQFEPFGVCREFAGQPRQHLAVDGNAAPLHARQHAHHRPLQRLIDGRHPVSGEARLHREPEPERNVGFLCGIFCRPADIDIVESHARFSTSGQRIEIDRRVIEIPGREESDIVIRASGVEHVGLQQGVVERRDADAALREQQPDEFQIVPDLEDAGILQYGLDGLDRLNLANLFGFEAVVEQALAGAAFAVRERDVAGFVRTPPRARSRTTSPASDRCWSFRLRSPARLSRSRAPSRLSAARGRAPLRIWSGRPGCCGLSAPARPQARPASRTRPLPFPQRTGATSRNHRRPLAALPSLRFAPPAVSAACRNSAWSSASTCDASISAISATRRVRVENSIALRNAIRFL